MEKSIFKDPGLYVMVSIGLLIMIFLPIMMDMFAIMQITQYVVLSVYALSLAYIWGYGGILSFGQSCFFGLGEYKFAVASINMGATSLPFILAIIIPAF